MKRHYILLLALLASFGCSKPLEEEVYSSLGPSNFYQTAADAEALLNATYASSQGYRDLARNYLTFGELTTDILIERNGAINTFMQPVEDFVWDASHPWLTIVWTNWYTSIFRANTVIDKVPAITMNEDRKQQIVAEARFLRALAYFNLFDLFGPVPLVTSSETSPADRPFRATRDEMLSFLADEFSAAAQILPVNQSDFPRATKGAALGMLAKLKLNNHEWQDAASFAQDVINLGVYHLYAGANRADLFALANKRDAEFIFTIPYVVDPGTGNTYLSHAAPPGYKFQFPPKTNFAAQFKIRSAFVNLFAADDERRNGFLFSYTNTAGATINLGTDDVRSFKYPEDPNGVGDVSGNYFPVLRYADMLLTRSEALNEIGGPSQEAVDLLNAVREVAGISLFSTADFGSKEALRDTLLAERGREFHTEALRRQDLLRQDKFISMALQRGKPAQEFQKLYPIPQREIDANENLEQNPGY